MRKLLFLLLFVPSSMCMAQDVIVKKDGTTILSKVLEVNPADIKYKKYSNQNGPTYTITKAEVMSINYEGGDKDVFTDSQPATQQAPTNGGFEVNPNLEADNLKLVQQFNQRDLLYTGGKGQNANNFVGVFGMKEGSILENSELKVDYSMKRFVTHQNGKESKMTDFDLKTGFGWNRLYEEWMCLIVTLTNKTDKSIYVDLANSFLIFGKRGTKSMYVQTATTSTTASSSGSNVGLGGVLGGMAGGISVGGSTTNMSSTTTYAQRIIIIPPMSTFTLPAQNIGKSYDGSGYRNGHKIGLDSDFLNCYAPFFMEHGLAEDNDKFYNFLFDKLNVGETVNMPMPADMPLTVHLSYSFEEDQKNHKSIRTEFYLRKLMGARDTGNGDRIDFTEMDNSQHPMLYLIRFKRLAR